MFHGGQNKILQAAQSPYRTAGDQLSGERKKRKYHERTSLFNFKLMINDGIIITVNSETKLAKWEMFITSGLPETVLFTEASKGQKKKNEISGRLS